MTGENAPEDTSGYFEVELLGAIIHSKKNGGGYVDTIEKEDAIMNAIANALNPSESKVEEVVKTTLKAEVANTDNSCSEGTSCDDKTATGEGGCSTGTEGKAEVNVSY